MLVATYGSPNAFNIKIYDLAGGGYYAFLCESNLQIFQRRGASPDIVLYQAGNQGNFTDRYTSFSYDPTAKILTMKGAIDTFNGIRYTRTETYRFVSDYVVENAWTITADKNGGGVQGTNWNYYTSAYRIWDIDNANFGDGGSYNHLGIALQLGSGGPLYGTVSDSQYGVKRNNEKRALVSQLGIASNWIIPGNGEYGLTADVPLTLTQWFFKSDPNFYDLMLKSTLAVADAKGWKGTNWDKICQFTAYDSIGLMSNQTDIKLLPSPKYNGMWCRDSFWVSLLTNVVTNEMEANCMAQFKANQQASGQIPTMLADGGGIGQLYHDEGAMLHIIRYYYDMVNRGLTPDMGVLTKCVQYIATQITGNKWLQNAGSTQSWIDTFIFTGGEYEGYNQGVYAVALKCALKMGVPGVTQQMIDYAIVAYQGLYDVSDGYIHYTSLSNYVTTVVLTGEALSNWLFGEKMLTSTQVINHLNKIQAVAMTGAGAKLICTKTGGYLSGSLFSPFQTPGDYQNGGSWFLYEYFAYLAGAYHGWKQAQASINARIEIEMQKEPVSHEYLQTDSALSYYASEPTDRHVYGWNAASFVIKQQANGISSNVPYGGDKAEIF